MDYFDQQRLIQDEYSQKFEDHHKKYKCDHATLEVTKRIIAGGSVQFMRQCKRCGKPVGGAIKKEIAFKESFHGQPKAFNQELYEQWGENQNDEFSKIFHDRKAEHEKLNQIFGVEESRDKEKFFNIYNRHLKSEKWKAIREKVLKRANHICEGCLEEKATQVHHLDYKNVGDELLFQLVAICDVCHDKCHLKT